MTIETRPRVDPRDHVVLFYEDDHELVSTVGRYLVDGLLEGESVVVVATPQHIAAFDTTLAHAGIDIGAARTNGTLLTIAADDALSQFLVRGWPDPDAFATGIGDLMQRMSEGGRRVRVYGEMVALLWDSGQVAAAIELEALWNDLGEHLSFSLFCAYPVESFTEHDQGGSFHRLCQSHSAVVGDAPEWPTAVGTLDTGRADATRAFACDANELSAARQFVVEILRAWKLDRLVEDAAIVVSELATNAILHARTDYIVTVSSLSGTVRIAVRDSSLHLPAVRDPAPNNVSGRGLILVDTIARSWGTERIADGKVVWVELLS